MFLGHKTQKKRPKPVVKVHVGNGAKSCQNHRLLKYVGVDNLYVCDLSVFPISPPANPTLTLAALALRLADYLKKDSENGPWELGEMPHSRKEDKWAEPRAGEAKL